MKVYYMEGHDGFGEQTVIMDTNKTKLKRLANRLKKEKEAFLDESVESVTFNRGVKDSIFQAMHMGARLGGNFDIFHYSEDGR